MGKEKNDEEMKVIDEKMEKRNKT
jgi:hypothetical protein